MTQSTDNQEKLFISWANENLGPKSGSWYAPYLKNLGTFLEKFHLGKNYQSNFFRYETYTEFKELYEHFIGQSPGDIDEILKGKLLRYPDRYAEMKLAWNNGYAQYRVDNGISSSINWGGIADLGALFRAYLKFLYYTENSDLPYPKKHSIYSSYPDSLDDSINYWIYSPGEDGKMWGEFYSNGVLGIGWDYLGDLSSYPNISRETIENNISAHRDNGKKPRNDSKAVWEFYDTMKPGDIVYAKTGTQRILGKGIITGSYYFDATVQEYKHKRKIQWISRGEWILPDKIALKTLTKFNAYPELIILLEHLVNGDTIKTDITVQEEFRIWLSTQIQSNGKSLDSKTIEQKINALEDIEKTFIAPIFSESDLESLKNIKDTVLAATNYDRYKGVSRSTIDYFIRFIETKPRVESAETYFLDTFLQEVFIDKDSTETLKSIIENRKNLILKGAPGVGKTYIADRLAYLMMEEKDTTRVQMIQFHQSYSYEDFIEGYRPKAEGDGFELKQGPFIKFARTASRDLERDYFFIIDEINRGNMSRIFGELLMLIETDKRGQSINLLYSNEKFSVPPNLYIIGMMNTADRSLALLDYALRRRFAFFELTPAFENNNFIEYCNKTKISNQLLQVLATIKELNTSICQSFGSGFQIGHSYFINDVFNDTTLAKKRLEEIIKFEIIPQLYEYWFDNTDKAEEWSQKLQGACNDAK